MTTEEREFEGMCAHCGGTGKKNDRVCHVCKGRGKTVFKMAPQQAVDYLHYYVDIVMKAIEKATGIRGAFITDMSSIADFPVEDAELAVIEKELGMAVHYEDRIVDLASRLKDA